jgi:hypothetical protein
MEGGGAGLFTTKKTPRRTTWLTQEHINARNSDESTDSPKIASPRL